MNKPNPSEMCAPGYHVVRGHKRICKSGTATWVDEHIRKNHGKVRPGLLQENIWYLFWNNKKKYPALKPIVGFKNKGAEYDAAIQFWLDYWIAQGVKYPEGLSPLMIKSIIALESGFNEVAQNSSSSADGLMQITDRFLPILGGFPRKDGYQEAKDHFIHIRKEDKLDPIINICLGIRLIGHTYYLMRNHKSKNVWDLIARFNSTKPDGENYAKKVKKLYEESK